MAVKLNCHKVSPFTVRIATAAAVELIVKSANEFADQSNRLNWIVALALRKLIGWIQKKKNPATNLLKIVTGNIG